MNLLEFENWAISQGSVENPAPNNKYKGQCVSLIQQYLYHVFNMPFKPRGNAKDWANNIPENFVKISSSSKLQSGDIIVYGSNYGGGYGHMGLIDVNKKYSDQNGVKKLAIGYRDKPFSGYVCILRPNNQVKLGLNSSGTSFTVRIDKLEAAVRSQPTSKSDFAGNKILKKGDTFEAIETVNGESVNGNNIWYKSWKGNFVWSGGCTII